MEITNDYIADQFSLLSKLMDIHGENSFKTKSYSIAAFTIEKLPEQLASLTPDKIFSIKGIGDNIGKKIMSILNTGELAQMNEIIDKTPPGVVEMLNIKGLGPKKIATIWKEMEIESIGELLYACNENRLLLYKGFGEKTQKNIRDTIEFYLRSQGSFLFAEVEGYVLSVHKKLRETFPGQLISISGAFRRQLEIIDQALWITSIPLTDLKSFFTSLHFRIEEEKPDELLISGDENIKLQFQIVPAPSFHHRVFETSCSDSFLEKWKPLFRLIPSAGPEEMIFEQAGIHFIPPPLREDPAIIEKARKMPLPELIRFSDIKGIIHSHSNWSDGSQTVEEMAQACIKDGFEYLVISDHSKSAFYANGLSEERIRAQHLQIEALNAQFSPFRIFKSIECDILYDGSLDYSNSVLSTFDLVIASVHSNLKMTEEKAMLRLLSAIE